LLIPPAAQVLGRERFAPRKKHFPGHFPVESGEVVGSAPPTPVRYAMHYARKMFARAFFDAVLCSTESCADFSPLAIMQIIHNRE
jgi:hypothetical protein